MANLSESEDLVLLEALKMGSQRAFSLLFEKYYLDLVMFAGVYIHDQDACEDIVQNVFMELWRGHETLGVMSSLRSYLIVCTRNRCFNELEHRKVISEHVRFEMRNKDVFDSHADEYIMFSELKILIDKLLDKLKPAERQAFELSRTGGLTHKKIAVIQNCSVKTVEARICNVLKTIRRSIEKNYEPI